MLAEASLSFGAGFNVLSGETGAGKSMVVDALGLLAGGRADSSLIRTGADRLSVTGVFEPEGTQWRDLLAEAGVETSESELVVRREVHREGRNRIFLNDQPITQRLLARLGPFLMTLHGQREELGLLLPELQRDWLDLSAGRAAVLLRRRVQEAFDHYRETRARLDRVSGDDRVRLERVDLLRFQIQEIDAVSLTAGEEVELRSERDQLRNAESILTGLSEAGIGLSEHAHSALSQLETVRRSIETIRRWIPDSAEWLVELEEARIRVQDVSDSIDRRSSMTDLDPARLDKVEDRLVTLERLCRRFGDSSQEVLAFRDSALAELANLEVDEQGRQRLEAEVTQSLESYRELAIQLSTKRRAWAELLASRVQEELSDLALGRALFSTELAHRVRADSPLHLEGADVEFGPLGVDKVTFEFAANPGEQSRPLSRVASGGELARVYLALQLAVRGSGSASGSVMVFDEVDTGIGGREAAAVGRKLRRLATGGQILAVTHLPQVASCAHRHFKIQKRVEDGRTFVGIESLREDGRVDEVARMLAGDAITTLSRSHARELIDAGALE